MRRLPRLTPTRIVAFLAVLLVGYFAFTAVGDTLLSQRLNRDEERLRREIDGLEQDRSELLAIRDYLQTDEYIEGVARRVLGLVRPDETLVIVSSSAPVAPTPAAEPREDDDRSWWERLYQP